MSNQRDEDFDSIYASIEDDDVEEMYVDVSSTPQHEGYGGPSPYVYPQAPQPPSPSVRRLPPLPVKSTVGAASKPPWPRKPQPPPNQPSIKIPKKASSEPNRDIPQPLPRVGTVKKKGPTAEKPLAKSRQAGQFQQKTGYSPPPPVIAVNSGQRQVHPGYQQYPGEPAANTATPKTFRYQDSGFGSGKDEPHYKMEYTREPPSSTGQKLLQHQPPPPNTPPPPPGGASGQDFTGQILNTPGADESEYESLRPARQRILRGFGQQSRRSRRYSDDRIPLRDMASNHEDSMNDRGYQTRREKERGGGENNSRIVCILLTIIVIALLISLMSLVMSLYTLTRFELSRRVNNTASECDIKVSNCTTDMSDLECQPDTVS